MKLRDLKLAGSVAALAIAVAAPALAQDRTLRLGHLANEDNSWHLASLHFAEQLSELTDGRIAVEVFPNESLGREIDMINGMQLGTVDMTITGESLQNWTPMAALLAIPYGYQSLEDMDEIASGEIGAMVEQSIIDMAEIRPIAYFARGPRHLTANRAITSPDELDGLRLRVPNVPLFVDTWQALGARPTPMAFGEVFTSLQSGTIDAQENPLALIRSASFNEVQSHVNMTAHVRSWIYLTLSEITWNSLSEEDQAAVMEAASRAQAFEREIFEAEEDAHREHLENAGMTFVEVDQAAFAEQSRDAVLSNVPDEIREIVEGLFDR